MLRPSKDWLRQRIHGPQTKSIARRIYYLPIDAVDAVLRRRPALVPPKGKIFVGDQSDFVETGEEFFRYFVDLAELKPHEDVLDVGSGIGRMARPLTSYLSSGTYEGLDIVPAGIRWCDRVITHAHPNFRFRLANVRNDAYNPKGALGAAEYAFPYESGSFDFVFLTSVFTHMLPRDMENYLNEVRRVLRDGGRCLITYFLLNEESLACLGQRRSTLDFKYSLQGFRTVDVQSPERAVAYDEAGVRSLFGQVGLRMRETIHYGSWCGRERFLSYQDIVLADRVPST